VLALGVDSDSRKHNNLSTTALLLVLTAAILHAVWNYFLKKSGGGVGLVALSTVLSSFILTPLAIFLIARGYSPTWIEAGVCLGSGVIHTIYFLLLDRAYRSGGDLSVVYPLARATGPLLTIIAATLWLGEKITLVALGGAVLIGLSALLLSGNPASFKGRAARKSIRFAVAAGCMIACYTVWDKIAVSVLLMPPLLFYAGSNLARVPFLVPIALRRAPGGMTKAWREQRRAALMIALLSPLSFILVLYAMQLAPVSYVAPAREVSILFAALIGAHMLKEGESLRRIVAAIGMVLGITALVLG
jgi:drug/metabolite transporter (DMT)-like permease